MLLPHGGAVRGAAQVHHFHQARGRELRRVSYLPTPWMEAAVRSQAGQAAVRHQRAGLGKLNDGGRVGRGVSLHCVYFVEVVVV